MSKRPYLYSRKLWSVVVGLVLVLFLILFIRLPYFVKAPGSAEPLKERVSVPGREQVEKGDFLFTTVSQLEKPNVFFLGMSLLMDKYSEVVPLEKAIGTIKNVDAYDQLVNWMRTDSESSALIAAYRHLGRPIEVEQKGIIIQSFLKGSPASKQLLEGDILKAVNGEPIHTAEELAAKLKGKEAGEQIEVTVERGKNSINATVPLIELKGKGPTRVGIGFSYAQVQKAVAPDPIVFHMDDIGGPSAGLMLTLDLLTKLSGTDYTHGHRIAGTGTIDADGNVGQIGGIHFKLVAANREHAEIFLVPKDKNPGDGNQKEAEAFLQTYPTKMKLVPVGTLKEATDYLSQLSDKQ